MELRNLNFEVHADILEKLTNFEYACTLETNHNCDIVTGGREESQGAKVWLVLELNPIHQAVTYSTCDTVSDFYAPCFSFTILHIPPC